MGTHKLWQDALGRAGKAPKLYEHERLLKAKRDAAHELYEALSDLLADPESLGKQDDARALLTKIGGDS